MKKHQTNMPRGNKYRCIAPFASMRAIPNTPRKMVRTEEYGWRVLWVTYPRVLRTWKEKKNAPNGT